MIQFFLCFIWSVQRNIFLKVSRVYFSCSWFFSSFFLKQKKNFSYCIKLFKLQSNLPSTACLLETDWVPETWVLEVSWRNGFIKIFFNFFAKFFGIFDDFSKWSMSKVLQNFKKWSKMPKTFRKKWRKAALFNSP